MTPLPPMASAVVSLLAVPAAFQAGRGWAIAAMVLAAGSLLWELYGPYPDAPAPSDEDASEDAPVVETPSPPVTLGDPVVAAPIVPGKRPEAKVGPGTTGWARDSVHITEPVAPGDIYDGDSIRIRMLSARPGSELQQSVRVAHIDAPEVGRNAQAHGIQSRDALRAFLAGKRLRLITGRKLEQSYGRPIVEVETDTEPPVDVSEWMIANGHAWWYEKYSKRTELREVQNAAKRAKLGLWSKPGAIEPEQHRRGLEPNKPI